MKDRQDSVCSEMPYIGSSFLWNPVSWFAVYTFFFYKQSIFDPRPQNCLSFSKKLPQKIV